MLAAEGEGSLIGRLSAGVNKRAGVESESGTSYIKRKLVKEVWDHQTCPYIKVIFIG